MFCHFNGYGDGGGGSICDENTIITPTSNGIGLYNVSNKRSKLYNFNGAKNPNLIQLQTHMSVVNI